jgi:hypothetical protein
MEWHRNDRLGRLQWFEQRREVLRASWPYANGNSDSYAHTYTYTNRDPKTYTYCKT